MSARASAQVIDLDAYRRRREESRAVTPRAEAALVPTVTPMPVAMWSPYGPAWIWVGVPTQSLVWTG